MSCDPVDIKAKAPFPAGALSNFAPHAFALDGIACGSMEGFLQSLKIQDSAEQARVCRLSGAEAQSRGRQEDWNSGTLWWQGKPVDRLSDAYQKLLDRAYDALFAQAPKFRNALAATGEAPLTHRMGKSDPCETILTEQEFCTRLERLRAHFGDRSSTRSRG
ncbi:hypothetical protein B1812_20630 [Methylocystis bryophila]|uniref:Uncharacterized protein n=2 Tax=Methylocystis bryophila TaxID=655015 RepID=A0A1W6N218_9HYPH|nr:hypothetical protein B1812_20630 [Methylocystis bryophila]